MQFNKTMTYTNLARSFAGESQAGMHYQLIAKLAIAEEYPVLADNIRTIAKNETNHAKTFFDTLVLKAGSRARKGLKTLRRCSSAWREWSASMRSCSVICTTHSKTACCTSGTSRRCGCAANAATAPPPRRRGNFARCARQRRVTLKYPYHSIKHKGEKR